MCTGCVRWRVLRCGLLHPHLPGGPGADHRSHHSQQSVVSKGGREASLHPPLPPPPPPSLPPPPPPPPPPDCAVHYTVPAWQIAVPTVVVAVLLGIMLIVGIKLCVVFYVSWAALIVAHFSAVLQYAPHHNQWIYVGLLGVPKMAEADCGGGPQHGTTALYLC